MRGVLLDTHAFLWVLLNARDLSHSARQTLSLRSTIPYVSVASLWEITIKIAKGSLEFDDPLEVVIEQEFSANGYIKLDIENHHLTELLKLPNQHAAHGDPFDRILAAQSRAEGIEILSADAKLDAYGVRRIW